MRELLGLIIAPTNESQAENAGVATRMSGASHIIATGYGLYGTDRIPA
ncbi:hypothetical protein IL54_3250 [Sphingobium sp. ba1]|nr:hypothetical protein IL54_3250 [Sphingobium sp. ba1]